MIIQLKLYKMLLKQLLKIVELLDLEVLAETR